MARKPVCDSHCGGCGRHFSSLRAFDEHRSGVWRNGQWETRFCVDPADTEVLRVATREAGCRVEQLDGVTLWEHGPDADRARTRFATAVAA